MTQSQDISSKDNREKQWHKGVQYLGNRNDVGNII